MKIKTIWHYAFAFFESESDLEQAYLQIEGEPFYKGEITKKLQKLHKYILTALNTTNLQ